jgi:hypothetical protein
MRGGEGPPVIIDMGGKRRRTFVECKNPLFLHGLNQNIHGTFLGGIVRECVARRPE